MFRCHQLLKIITCLMYAHGFEYLVLLTNKDLTEDLPQKILFKPDDPWITNEKDMEPYTWEHLDNVKLYRTQCILTSIINYGCYVNNMFALENFALNFH